MTKRPGPHAPPFSALRASVAVASDGDVALRLPKQQAADLILLVLRMPHRDGLSVLQALRAPQLVVLVSAYSMDEALQAPADASVMTYLERPIQPRRLLETVAATLRRSQIDGD